MRSYAAPTNDVRFSGLAEEVETVTASEFAFLAVGLVLGIAAGAALVDISRGRPSNSREVRVTVAPGSVPKRRSATLAEDAFAGMPQAPARGGPGDRDETVWQPAPPSPVGTIVRSATPEPEPAAVGIPIHRETDPALASLRAAAAQTAEQAMTDQRMTIAAIFDARAATAVASTGGPGGRPAANSAVAVGETRPMALADTVAGTSREGSNGGAPEVDDACAEVRRVADERCTIAARSREQATAAQEAMRTAQRQYDDHHTIAEQAAIEADPRQMRVAKEAAQNAFRHARAAATTRQSVEGAARDWLTEINRINHDAREAASRLQRERAAANLLVTQIERLTVESDAARISAETADAACLSARQAVADCQEAATAPARPAFVPAPAATVGFGSPGAGLPDEEREELEAAFSLRGNEEPAILRIVRGEQEVLATVVEALARGDAAERDRWQALLGQFIEMLIARAIEASALTFPIEHPFWGAFSLAQNRDIVSALSSLGYRYDGLGGWVDERMPSQRDLSLAVGYAGLDPMRVRHWPTEGETAELLQDIAAAVDEYLTETAGGLTLGELVSTLGRRADDLTELWNDWGRVRPLLLSA